VAQNTVYVMEKANIFAGDTDPSHSNHLTVSGLKLPGLEQNLVDHAPGGAPIAIDVPTHITRLESTFNLAGWQPYVMQLIGLTRRANMHFTAYGLIRDRRTSEAIQARCIMFGQLGRVNPTEFRHGDLQHHEYSIRGITHYELYFKDDEIYYWDFFTSTFRIGGEEQNADMNRTLSIG
jgi:P2 family phage contractile tail tube protein